MPSNFIRIVAPDDMDSDDQFKIWSDYGNNPGQFTELATVNSADRGDGQYNAYSTTLAASVTTRTQISLTFSSGANFSDGDYVFVGKEGPILLGGKSGDIFASCTRGPIPLLHDITAGTVAIYKAHITYEHESVDWGTAPNERHVIRYLVRALVDGTLRSGAPVKKFNPPVQLDNSRCFVYGVMEASVISQSGSGILAGETVAATILDGDNFLPTPGTSLIQRVATATTDLDGFWYLSLPRVRVQEGGDTYVITLASNRNTGDGQEQWAISNVPDQDSVHFMAITEAITA